MGFHGNYRPVAPVVQGGAADDIPELTGEVELVVKPHTGCDLLDRLFREPEQLLRLLHAEADKVQNRRHTHHLREQVGKA